MKKFLLLLSFSFVFSAILRVPDEYPTIQEAVDNHVQGDTVLVAPGTHLVDYHIDIQDSRISIISEGGSSQTFIIGETDNFFRSFYVLVVIVFFG